jgi:hypothetical protein
MRGGYISGVLGYAVLKIGKKQDLFLPFVIALPAH